MGCELTLEITERVKLGEPISAWGELREDGIPLNDAAVWLWIDDIGMGHAKTDESGAYEFQITFLKDKMIAQGKVVKEELIKGIGEKTLRVEHMDWSGEEILASCAKRIRVVEEK